MKHFYLLSLALLIGNNLSYSQTFTRINDLLNPITIDAFDSGGGSWVDINNDGLLDLFVSNGNLNSQNNSLYLNTGNGNFIKVITGNISTDGGSSIGSTWGDFNNDGFLDCFVTNRNNFGNFLYQGNGDTVFTKIITGSIITDITNSNSSSWVDYDNDGNLDLYVVNFMNSDYLYSNDGSPDFTFTSEVPLNNSGEFSIPGAWADYNNDLFPDLFIGNAGGQNDHLYTNNGGLTFTKTSFSDAITTLGASWADYDNDGDLDLFVTGYLNNACILYKNSGNPSFSLTPVSGNSVLISGNSVGSAWGDIDNDGDLDLFICDDGSNNHLFLNDGGPNYTFTEVTSGSVVSDGGHSFGGVFGDYNNDGQLDLFVANQMGEQNFLYMNDGNSNHWLTIKCQGTTTNKSGMGTKVYLKAMINGNAEWQMQEVEAQTGYNSQNLWLHFGLGQSTTIDSMIVKWPSGQIDYCTNMDVDKFYTAIEGQCLPTGVSQLATAIHFNLIVSPNPITSQTKISYFLKSDENVRFSIFNILGEKIKIIFDDKQKGGFHDINFNVNEFESGIYLLELRTENGREIKSVILNK